MPSNKPAGAHSHEDHPSWRELASQRAPDAGYLPLGANRAIAERFFAAITPRDRDVPICRMRIAIESGRPVCTELCCERQDGGRPITQATLRAIPVAAYLTDAMAHTAFRITRTRDEGRGEQIEVDGAPAWEYDVAREPGARAEVHDAVGQLARSRQRRPRRGIPVSDDQLRAIAETYRVALAERRRPTKAVVEAENVSRATASRWIARARQLGYLGPARPGAAGWIEQRED